MWMISTNKNRREIILVSDNHLLTVFFIASNFGVAIFYAQYITIVIAILRLLILITIY